MRVKYITGTFHKGDITIEMLDAGAKGAGEVIAPKYYSNFEAEYPGFQAGIKSNLFFYDRAPTYYGLVLIEEEHPFFNIDLIAEILDVDDPIEERWFKAVCKLLSPYLN